MRDHDDPAPPSPLTGWYLHRARWALVFAVVLCIGTTGWSAGSALLLRERGEPVEAVVRGFVVHSRRGETKRPVWAYRFEGRSYEHRAPVGDGSLDVGDRAVLLVDPGDPGDALQRDELWRQTRLVAMITGALVLFASLCYLFVRRIARRRHSRSSRNAASSSSSIVS